MSYARRRRALGQAPLLTAAGLARPTSATTPAPIASTSTTGPQSAADCAPGQGFTRRRTDGVGVCFNCMTPMPSGWVQPSPWSGYRPPAPGTCGVGDCVTTTIPLLSMLQTIWFPCSVGDQSNATWMRTANVASALVAGGLAYRRWKTPGAAAAAAGLAFVVLPGAAMGAVRLAFRGIMTR